MKKHGSNTENISPAVLRLGTKLWWHIAPLTFLHATMTLFELFEVSSCSNVCNEKNVSKTLVIFGQVMTALSHLGLKPSICTASIQVWTGLLRFPMPIFIVFQKSLTPSKIHQNSRQKLGFPEVPSKLLWYCWLMHNNRYPQWIKVVEGKVLLSFSSLFT